MRFAILLLLFFLSLYVRAFGPFPSLAPAFIEAALILFSDAFFFASSNVQEDSEEDERPRGKNKKKGNTNTQMKFTPEGGFAAASGAPGEKAECKQN